MRKLLLVLLFLLCSSYAYAVNTSTIYSVPAGQLLVTNWTATGAKKCLSGINGKTSNSWTVVTTGTVTVKVEFSPDNQVSFGTLITYTEASTTPISGESQTAATDLCIEVTVCTTCTVSASMLYKYEARNESK